MTGLILLPLECYQFMMWAEVWPLFTIGQYHDEIMEMDRHDILEYIQKRVLEN